MNRLWKPALLPLLRRDPGEIARRARGFHIGTEDGRNLVSRLGAAFLGGYNAILTKDSMSDVAAEGMRTPAHFRPFFFEGAAMGYLPRGYLSSGYAAKDAERSLLRMHPNFRYLYYVGLGFWFGMRHPRRPSALGALAPHIEPLYFPLCYDGLGFKIGFFDFPRKPSASRVLERCPGEGRAAIYQGFGRALFFVYMDDAAGFIRVRDALPSERRLDLEFGRSLALAFTGVDRPSRLLLHLAEAADRRELEARLLGTTWALTAREMNDPSYFSQCIEAAPSGGGDLLRRLAALCHEALAGSQSYLEWQEKTKTSVTRAYSDYRSSEAPQT